MNLKLNQKGDDSASEAYRLLIGFILGAAILVIIMNMINSTQNQLIIVSNQKLKEGLISAVKSTGTSAKTPFVIEDLMLKGNISKTTITNYTGLPEECMAFVAGPKLFSVNDYNVLNFAPYQSTYHAMVKLDEGPTIISWLVGVEPGKFDELFEKLPLKVKMEVQKREKYSYPVFRIVE